MTKDERSRPCGQGTNPQEGAEAFAGSGNSDYIRENTVAAMHRIPAFVEWIPGQAAVEDTPDLLR